MEVFKSVLWPIVAIGGLGLVFGALLAVAAKFFSVAGDPRVDEIRECLPGANCGSCGFPGCDGLAKAIVENGAPINSCTVANDESRTKMAAIMGVEAGSFRPLVAVVCCQANKQNEHIRYQYQGIEDCRAVSQLGGGQKMCAFSCLGYGNCVKVCPTGAISVVDDVAVVNPQKCIGCGKCAAECPRSVISIVPKDSAVTIRCRNHKVGKEVRESCEIGCIACGLCEKACKFGAIKLVDNLPVIDHDKCVGCYQCADKCPRKCIIPDTLQRKVAFINEGKCIGCTKCARTCQFGAIESEVKVPHRVDPDKCAHCGQCAEACPKDAITMIEK